jgi:hypothetical protein
MNRLAERACGLLFLAATGVFALAAATEAEAGVGGDMAGFTYVGHMSSAIAPAVKALMPVLPHAGLALAIIVACGAALLRLAKSRYAPRASQTIYARPTAFIAMWPMSPGQSDLERARK